MIYSKPWPIVVCGFDITSCGAVTLYEVRGHLAKVRPCSKIALPSLVGLVPGEYAADLPARGPTMTPDPVADPGGFDSTLAFVMHI